MKISFIFLRSRSRSICTLITLIASFGTPFSLEAQAIKTNILSDFAMMPSIAVELPLGRRLSLDVGYNGAWWENRASAFCVKSHGGQLDSVRTVHGKIIPAGILVVVIRNQKQNNTLMKQNTEISRKNSTEIYYSPTAEVITVNSQNVLCQSGQSFGLDDDTFTNGDLDNPWN